MLVNGTSGYNDGDFAEFDDDHGCHEVCQQGNEAIVCEVRSEQVGEVSSKMLPQGLIAVYTRR